MKFTRAVASLAVLCIAGQTALADVAQTSLWAERHQARSSGENPLFAALPAGLHVLGQSTIRPSSAVRGVSVPASSPLYAALSAIPNDRLNVVDVVPGSDRKFPIVLIQDVHLNAEAQMNIAAAIERLSSEAKLGGVYLEGAFGPLDFNRLRAIPRDIREPLAEDMLKHGRMGGPSLAAMAIDNGPSFVGADEEKPFQDNAAVVVEASSARAGSDAAITELGRRLVDEKKRLYGPSMMAYDRLLDGYRGGSVSLGEFVSRLDAAGMRPDAEIRRFLEAFRYEKCLDLPKVERERRSVLERLAAKLTEKEISGLIAESAAYRDGRIGFAAYHEHLESLCGRHAIDLGRTPAFKRYLDYVALADEIDVNRLVASIDRGQKGLIERIAKTSAERDLARRDELQYLAGKLVRFELTPTEWHQWSRIKPNPTDPEWAAANLSLFERFYALADRRSRILADAVLKSPATASAVLVAGGFHTEGLIRALAASGRPVIVTAPRLTAAPDSATRYLDAFTREKAPLDRLFSGEKLTLNPPGQVLGGNGLSQARTTETLSRSAALIRAKGREIPAGMKTVAVAAEPNVWKTTVGNISATIATGPHSNQFSDLDESAIGGTTAVRSTSRTSRFDDSASSPGAWALFWHLPLNLLNRIRPNLGNRARPVVSGLGEGLLAAGLAIYFSARVAGIDPVAGLTYGIVIWTLINIAFHYAFGVYRFNPKRQIWEVQRYLFFGRDNIPNDEFDQPLSTMGLPFLRFAMPDGAYWRANLAATTSLVGFLTMALDGGILLTIMMSTIPHILVNYTKERRSNELRRRATEEKKKKYQDNGQTAEILNRKRFGTYVAGTNAEIDKVLNELLAGNDLASYMRFLQSPPERFRVVTMLQPGSVKDKEGTGFKAFNDTVGYDTMNIVWRHRNAYAWDLIQKAFADLKVGDQTPVRIIGGNYKMLRFAVDVDLITRNRHQNPADLENQIAKRLSMVTSQLSDHMREYMTNENDPSADITVIGAVRAAQNAGKLPDVIKAVPMFWGMSSEPTETPTLETMVSLDAEASIAVNMLRARNAEGRPNGLHFNVQQAREAVRIIARERQILIDRGLIKDVERPGRPTRKILPQDLIDAYRKTKEKEFIPMMKDYLPPGQTDKQLKDTYEHLSAYIANLSSFDIIKPWVGTEEKPEALKLAEKVNEAITLLQGVRSRTTDAERDDLWKDARDAAVAGLSKDTRAPFLGSTFDFYGSLPTDPEKTKDEAIMFIDFRGFGATIVIELEDVAERLLAADAAGEDAFKSTLTHEMAVLADDALDIFAASLRQIRTDFENRFQGASMRFYFGGDDVAIAIPKELVYDDNDRVDRSLIVSIFRRIPASMRIRMIIGSTTPFRARKDLALEAAIAMTGNDELADEAKKAEKKWKIDGKKVNEVVAFTDKTGARWRMAVNDREAPGQTERVHPGFDDTASFITLQLMTLYLYAFDRKASMADARLWAESKMDDSVILLGGVTSVVELWMIPGVPLILSSFLGIYASIFLGAIFIVAFHEIWPMLKQAFRQYVLRKAIRRPFEPSGWVEKFWGRALMRFFVSATIIALSFLAVAPLINAGVYDPFSFAQNITAYLVAMQTHAMWNSFSPIAWRLSLSGSPRAEGPPDNVHPAEDAEVAAALRILYDDRTLDRSRHRLVELGSALPISLGVENATGPRWDQTSTGISARIDHWKSVGAISGVNAARLGRTVNADLRQAITGRQEKGTTNEPLEMSSETALFDQMGREKEAKETPADLFGYRIIAGEKPGDAVSQAAAAVASSERLGAGRITLVVKGKADRDAVEEMLRTAGKLGTVQLIEWTDGLTMKELQNLTEKWLFDSGLMTREAAALALKSANFRLVLPDPQAFTLPADFLKGVDNIDRYRVFLVVQAVLLAVEIRPDSLENAQAIAALVAKQA